MEKFTLTDAQKESFKNFSLFVKVCQANHDVLDTIIQNPYSTVGDIREKTNIANDTLSKFLTIGEKIGAFDTFVRTNPNGKGTITQILFNPTTEFKLVFNYLLDLPNLERNDKRQRKR